MANIIDLNYSSKLEAQFIGKDIAYDLGLNLMNTCHKNISNNHDCHQLLLLEHKAVITITRSHDLQSILSSKDDITHNDIDFHYADRGGDVTFHGPGQLVGYPIVKLNKDPYTDLNGYIRQLERSLLNAMHDLGINEAQTINGYTGIWVALKNKTIGLKKLIAIGVGVKDSVTKHGFALNINIDASPYMKHIIPCGLKNRGVISLQELYCQKNLKMPDYSFIVKTIAAKIADQFFLKLSWSEKGDLI